MTAVGSSSQSWPEVELGDICEFAYGKSLPAKSRTGVGFPVFGSNGAIGLHEVALTDGETIIVGRKGSFGEVHYCEGPCFPIDTTYYITQHQSDAYLPWLVRRLRCLGLDQLNRAAAIPGLNRADAYRQKLLLPPLAEQKRIAGILDAADALRATRREALAQLDTLLQATFLDMFGDPVMNPMGWEVVPLQSLIDEDRPITYGILKPGPDIENGIPYVRVVDIQNEQVLTDQLRRTTKEIADQYRRSQLKPGDLLMSIRGHVGRMAITPGNADGANITQDTARLALADADATYVMQCISTQGMQHYMARRTKGVAVRGINLGDVKKLPIPTPPLHLQRRFAAIVESVEEQRTRMRTHLTELDTLFACLQSRAFNGEL
jgi:type I restriction enzyme, S subunit